MKLAVVTKPTFFIEEDKIITRLFEEELDYLFLDKSYPHPQYIERLLNLIPKKFHKRANRRNLHKRRMREAYRLGRDGICERLRQSGKHLQIAFIYSTKECHSYKTISNAVQRILEQVSKAV